MHTDTLHSFIHCYPKAFEKLSGGSAHNSENKWKTVCITKKAVEPKSIMDNYGSFQAFNYSVVEHDNRLHHDCDIQKQG